MTNRNRKKRRSTACNATGPADDAGVSRAGLSEAGSIPVILTETARIARPRIIGKSDSSCGRPSGSHVIGNKGGVARPGTPFLRPTLQIGQVPRADRKTNVRNLKNSSRGGPDFLKSAGHFKTCGKAAARAGRFRRAATATPRRGHRSNRHGGPFAPGCRSRRKSTRRQSVPAASCKWRRHWTFRRPGR